jgi:hypothetical protein
MGHEINVRVDPGDLDLANCLGILIANEQGPAFFRRYSDSSGIVLDDGEIGSWGEVTADEATISDQEERLGFTLTKVSGAKFLRGREKRRAVSWIGLDYSIPPGQEPFSYGIRIGGSYG